MKRLIVFCVLAAFIEPSTAFAQSSGPKYPVSTIAAFISAMETNSDSDFTYSTQMLGAESNVIYLGEMRPVEGMRRQLVNNYFNMIRRPDVAPRFRSEILIREGSNQYWLVIEETIISKFKSRVKANTSLSVKYVWLGTVKTNNGREWILAVLEFRES